MSRTIVPDSDPLNENVSMARVLKFIFGLMETLMGDMDKAGNVEDHEYYAGGWDMLYDVRALITTPKRNTGSKVERTIDRKMARYKQGRCPDCDNGRFLPCDEDGIMYCPMCWWAED